VLPPPYRMRGAYSATTVGVYVVLLLLAWFVVYPNPQIADREFVYLFSALLLVLLARYLSTTYRIDAEYLHATRLIGGVRVPLRDIRRIEFSRMRELGPTGFFGSWGWRGRMWSPVTGSLNVIHTSASGLLVTGGTVPLFVSPVRPDEFARELSRRVRSHRVALEVDVGAPGPDPAHE
jgi:hypothetical protein